jgi:hypothetical protein
MGQLLAPSAGQSEYLHEEEVWGDDPVHLTSKGYGMVATGLESLIYEKRGEEREAEEKESQGPSKKPRYDAAESRPACVKGSVAEAVRRGGGGGQPRPPFKHPWRGGNQTRGGAYPEKGSGGDSRQHYSHGSGSGSGQPRDRGGYRGLCYGDSRGPSRGRGRPC